MRRSEARWSRVWTPLSYGVQKKEHGEREQQGATATTAIVTMLLARWLRSGRGAGREAE